MDSKITYTSPRRKAAYTLIEVMVASALGLLTVTVVAMLFWFSSRSFAATANYVALDQNSQLALDKMSREVRQARKLVGYSSTSLNLLDVDNNPLEFVWDKDSRRLMRISGDQTNTLLTGCDFLQFSKYQRNTISNTFDAVETAVVTNTKLIQVSWTCSRKIFGATVNTNTESVQSSKITLRNH